MKLSELVEEFETATEGLSSGDVKLEILYRKGVIKDYKITKTETIKDFQKDYTDNVFTWGARNYFIVLNEYLKDEEEWTEIEIFKHNSDDCLQTVDVFNNAYDTHEYIKTCCDEDIEYMIKEGLLPEVKRLKQGE
jgi:hypothetical protein